MSETSLEKYFNSLLPSLYEELVFFIPDKNIPVDILKKIDPFVSKLFNKLLVMDTYKGPIEYPKERKQMLTIAKGSDLEKNTFSLLERKRDATITEFNFILDKYFEQVEFLVYVTNWMNNNLNEILQVNDSIKGLFQIQSNNYNKHLHTLLRHFYPDKRRIPQSKFNAIKIIEKYYPDITKPDYLKSEVIKSRINNSVQEIEIAKNKTAAAKKAKKQPLITEKEAESILLERIFNVDIKSIN